MLRAAVLCGDMVPLPSWSNSHQQAWACPPSQKAGRVISKPAPELLATPSCTSCLHFCSSCSWIETLGSTRGLLNQGLCEGDAAVGGGVPPSQ